MKLRLFLLGFLLVQTLCASAATLNVGSKRFTESYILGEIIAGAAREAGEATVTHRQGLGNTAIVFAALKSGRIDVYPDYTGTIAFELLGQRRALSLSALNVALARHGLGAAVPLGFDNSYALAMTEQRAAALGISTISDLRGHAGLNLALSQEFLSRADGWPALRTAYGLPFAAPRGLDHGLAYEALAAGQVDLIDVYTTDAKIAKYGLRILGDDRQFFPEYQAVLVYRLDFPRRLPASWKRIKALEGSIDNQRMIAMNASAELYGVSFREIAAQFLRRSGEAGPDRGSFSRFLGLLFGDDFLRLTLDHLLLVFASLALSGLVGVPLGVWAARGPGAGWWIFGVVGLLQTVPSLALLAFLIAALGAIGTVPAIIALFLYALLPIVRNTAAGLSGISGALRQSAVALGLSATDRMRYIELPLALPALLAGVKTSAVINVGTATIAAFVGAGGYGDRIVAGLAVNDSAMLLAGAVPAAALALLIQSGFDLLERWTVPAAIRGRGH